jgi:hypothetical protein
MSSTIEAIFPFPYSADATISAVSLTGIGSPGLRGVPRPGKRAAVTELSALSSMDEHMRTVIHRTFEKAAVILAALYLALSPVTAARFPGRGTPRKPGEPIPVSETAEIVASAEYGKGKMASIVLDMIIQLNARLSVTGEWDAGSTPTIVAAKRELVNARRATRDVAGKYSPTENDGRISAELGLYTCSACLCLQLLSFIFIRQSWSAVDAGRGTWRRISTLVTSSALE